MCRTRHIDVIINCESVILIFFFSFYSKKENTALGIAESILFKATSILKIRRGRVIVETPYAVINTEH